MHRAIAQDKVGQDREYRFAPRALYPPDGHPAQADTDVMGVARQTPASLAGVLMCELKADGQDKSEHPFEERLAIVKQVSVGRFIVEIDGDGAVVSRLCG